jgi:hypothetical protein
VTTDSLGTGVPALGAGTIAGAAAAVGTGGAPYRVKWIFGRDEHPARRAAAPAAPR